MNGNSLAGYSLLPENIKNTAEMLSIHSISAVFYFLKFLIIDQDSTL
jgi:hypothetical protein